MGMVRVALLQMTGQSLDSAANQAQGDAFCRRAHSEGADIALFPEMWNIGYALPDLQQPQEREHWQAHAIDGQSEFVSHFRNLAQELNLAIAITYLEKWPGAPRNAVSLIDRQGEIVLTYAKVHTCDFSGEAALTPGDDFPVAALDTESGEVKVGFMICYDREFPESARILMLNGAELILAPNACTLDPGRVGQLRARAFENMVGVAVANYAAPRNNGHSAAFDAESYLPDALEPRDTLIVEAGEQEGVYLATFDMEAIRAYRARQAWGNAYRRPRCYGKLTDPGVQPPFVRSDARR